MLLWEFYNLLSITSLFTLNKFEFKQNTDVFLASIQPIKLKFKEFINFKIKECYFFIFINKYFDKIKKLLIKIYLRKNLLFFQIILQSIFISHLNKVTFH